MSTLLSFGITAVVLVVGGAGMVGAQQPKAAESPAHNHIGHVMTSWKDTPNTAGLLPTAAAEAEVAATHAKLAAKAPADLDGMKRHAGHVLNALDPSLEPKGPGAGYGVKKAAAGARQHVQLAAKMEGASKAITTHADHVATSMSNVLEWTDEAIATAQKIQASTSASDAAPLVAELVAQTTAINEGLDADKDGKIGWQKGEGGLAQARTHMGLMMKAEGL